MDLMDFFFINVSFIKNNNKFLFEDPFRIETNFTFLKPLGNTAVCRFWSFSSEHLYWNQISVVAFINKY